MNKQAHINHYKGGTVQTSGGPLRRHKKLAIIINTYQGRFKQFFTIIRSAHTITIVLVNI